MTPSASSPWQFDVNLRGYAGNRQGVQRATPAFSVSLLDLLNTNLETGLHSLFNPVHRLATGEGSNCMDCKTLSLLLAQAHSLCCHFVCCLPDRQQKERNPCDARRDSLGELDVPDDAYYGIQTVRCAGTIGVSDHTYSEYPEVIRAMAEIKKACALTNLHSELLSPEKAAGHSRRLRRDDRRPVQ